MAAEGSPLRGLQGLRDRLIALKQDRSTYIKSKDVLKAYDELCMYLQQMDDTQTTPAEVSDDAAVVEDCMHLISLLFLTIGRNNEAPACYSLCVITKRLLDHLNESTNFCQKDIQTIAPNLDKFASLIQRDATPANSAHMRRLSASLEACRASLLPLAETLDRIHPQLKNTQARLVSLRRCIKAAEAKRKFSATEVQRYVAEAREIDDARIDGKFVGEDGTIPSEGQELVERSLQRCYQMAEEALARQGAIHPSLMPQAEELYSIRSKLEKLELTQAWSLRETDLFDLQKPLMAYDDGRADKKFVGTDGSTPDEGQSILLYLLRRSYAHIYTLMSSSEPVSEALTPIFNQLQTVRRCLKEVQKFGISSPRELYPYSMKLNSIDNMRVDGKFTIGNDIPEGQGRVTSLLAECFEICQELRTACEEETA